MRKTNDRAIVQAEGVIIKEVEAIVAIAIY
jgi:hypothetical protein